MRCSPNNNSNSEQIRHKFSVSSAAFKDNLTSFWFLLPIVIIFIVLTLIPLMQSIFYSFTDFNGYDLNFHFIGLQKYQQVFSDTSLLSALIFTLMYSFIVTIVVTCLAIPLAVVLNQAMIGKSFLRSLFFFLGVPAQAVIGLIWQYIFSPLDSGVANQVLHTFGLPSIQWLSQDNCARFCVMFVAVWMQVGWHATLYIAWLQAIPADLYEQARVDGANGLQRFVHITLPQLIPGMVVSTFLLMTTALKIYDLPYTLTAGGPGHSTNTITQAIIMRGMGQSDVGLASALSTLFTIACVIVIAIQMKVSSTVARRFQ